MKIAISGCGITGTTVGFLLAEQGHDVTIFEQASECRPVGAGIMLQTSGQQVLQDLDMLQELMSVSERLNGMTAMLGSGRKLIGLDFSRLSEQTFAVGVHRGKLFERLLNRCRTAGVRIRNSCLVDSFMPESGAVRYSDPETESKNEEDGFAFLIGADGSRSRLRTSVPVETKVKEYDFAALWTTGPCEFQPGELYQVVDGTTRLLGLLPIGENCSSFFWGLPAQEWPELRNSNFAQWKEEALKLCPQASTILATINGFEDLTFGTYRNVSMKRWHSDGIIFLGDSAHATSPHLGQGVNLALEDAVCFSRSLEKTGDFSSACEFYTNERASKLRFYQRLTGMLTPFFQSHGVLKGVARNLALPLLPHLPFVGREMLRTLSGCKNGWLK